MKFLLVSISVVLLGYVEANCPGNMEHVHEMQKCYLFGTASSREDALKQCTDQDPTNHLWLINDQREMDVIVGHFGKRLISPWAWTDGVKTEETEGDFNIWKWSSSGFRMSFDPSKADSACDGKCVQDDCGVNSVGECATLSMSDAGAMSYQGCDCTASNFNFICETADSSDFQCPDDGLYQSKPCSDLFYNCFGGVAVPEYCDDGLVFNESAGYCDFPANVDGC